MMERRAFTAAALSATALGLAPGAGAACACKLSLYFVIENGGVIGDAEAAMITIKHALAEATNLRGSRKTRNAEISIVLTANPTQITWSGTPQQLLDNAAAVLELIAFRNTCSDLALAFGQVATTVELTFPDELRLYWIGAGHPCRISLRRRTHHASPAATHRYQGHAQGSGRTRERPAHDGRSRRPG